MRIETELHEPAAQREVDLDEREALLRAREGSLAERLTRAARILQAADQRDAIAEARDRQADTSDNDRYRSEFLDHHTLVHGDRWTERRDAVIAREHSSDDRSASRADRIALAGLTQ